MDPDRRRAGASVVVREAPHGAGGLVYLSRDAAGRPTWVRDPLKAERHPNLREAGRAALLAPPVAGSARPAFAVPLSVADDSSEPAPAVAEAGVAAAPRPAAPVEAADETAWCAGGLWMWSMCSIWVEAWSALLFRRDSARP